MIVEFDFDGLSVCICGVMIDFIVMDFDLFVECLL